MMMDELRPAADPRADRLKLILDLCGRVMGLVLIGAGVLHWAVILDVFSGEDWQFDSMRNAWKAATMVLAIAEPVAGVGLWLRVGWGEVTWFVAAVFEVVIHTAFQHTYGLDLGVVAFDVVSILIYAGLSMSERRIRGGS